jgi:hypothetical protein
MASDTTPKATTNAPKIATATYPDTVRPPLEIDPRWQYITRRVERRRAAGAGTVLKWADLARSG